MESHLLQRQNVHFLVVKGFEFDTLDLLCALWLACIYAL